MRKAIIHNNEITYEDIPSDQEHLYINTEEEPLPSLTDLMAQLNNIYSMIETLKTDENH